MHTPTPWRLLDNTGGKRTLVHVECEATLEPVCSIPRKRMADAAHIVHCVNTHDALVEALEDLVGLAEQAMREASKSGAEYDIAGELQAAKHALALAKKGG